MLISLSLQTNMMLLVVNVFIGFFIVSSNGFSIQYTRGDFYGSMLAANEHLVVSVVDRTHPRFAVYRPYNSSDFCILNINTTLNETYVTHVSVPSDYSSAPDYFFYQGTTLNGYTPDDLAIVRINVNFVSNCTYSYHWTKLLSSTPNDYSVFDVTSNGNMIFYLDSIMTYTMMYSPGNDSRINGRPAGNNPTFIHLAMDIADGNWGVIAGVIPTSAGYYTPTLYLINFPTTVASGVYNYNITDTWSASFVYSWQRILAKYFLSSGDYDPMYGMSLSINQQGDILFGVQFLNTVYLLRVNQINPTNFIFISSRIYSTTIPSIGFGKYVSWLDSTTAVILANNVSLDYTIWYSSQIEIYDLSLGQTFTDSTKAYSSFPTSQQPMYSSLSGQILVMTATYTGSVIFMDSWENVYMISLSSSGLFSYTGIGNTHGSKIYYSSPKICSAGSSIISLTGNKRIFDTCKPCPVGTFLPSTANTTTVCMACDTTKYFCSYGSIAQVPLSYTEKLSQTPSFPKSPPLTEFADILLLNMFSTNFTGNCLVRSPFFWTLLIIFLSMIVLITMAILQCTGKFENIRLKIESIFKHFDIISEGERWITGILSISIFVTIIFAALFTNSFLKQYPNSRSQAPDFTCDESLRNSQFSSRMQSLGVAIPDHAKTIFELLSSQRFTLVVTLLNTLIKSDIVLLQTVGSVTTKLNPTLSNPTDGCLMISSDLTADIAKITINISSTKIIGGVQIGLRAAAIVREHNIVQELNFANGFTINDRTLSQEPYFGIELIQIVNETKSLSNSEQSNYSGLWIPTYSKDDARNLFTLSDYEKYHTKPYTIIIVDITKAAYYIQNLEKPIIKTAGVIFKNILFASTCMEIIGFGVLVVKLAIVPTIRWIVNKVRPQEQEETEGDKENSDSENAEEEEDNDSDDDDEIPQIVKFGPGQNDWYTSDIKT